MTTTPPPAPGKGRQKARAVLAALRGADDPAALRARILRDRYGVCDTTPADGIPDDETEEDRIARLMDDDRAWKNLTAPPDGANVPDSFRAR